MVRILFFFFLYKTLFLRNYIRLHTTSSYQIDGPAETETIPLLMHWNRLSPIPKSSRWYQYIYMQTATYNKHPQTCFYKHNRYVNHIKITVHSIRYVYLCFTWWRHQMETFSALLALSALLAQMPVTRSFDVFFDRRLNKRLSNQSWGWRFETPSRSLWRHCNVFITGSTGRGHFDNFQCSQWWQFHQNEDIFHSARDADAQ